MSTPTPSGSMGERIAWRFWTSMAGRRVTRSRAYGAYLNGCWRCLVNPFHDEGGH